MTAVTPTLGQAAWAAILAAVRAAADGSAR
jgi:hypothetical protein